MKRKTLFWKMMRLLVTVAVMVGGFNLAQAGPGGGTYYANSPSGGASGTALRKFVDSLPGVGPANKNNLGQYIPVAQKFTPAQLPAGVPNDGGNSDYYEIGVVQYGEKMHSDLPKKTLLRGYKDLNPAFSNISAHYLGPLIIAKRDRPVRLKMRNLLPTGTAGNLFIPTDTSLMGAGMGPLKSNGLGGWITCSSTRPDPNNPTQNISENCPENVSYTQNRATFHLHGGNSPWISDGTPHQWTAPVGENSVPAAMLKGASTYNVPDMPNPGKPGVDGEMTFYWTNQQSNRLMFYHDHSLGLTRLNVYAGEAAGFILTDPIEEGLIDGGTLPNICPGLPTTVCDYRYGIPLIIQDKTFVPKNIDVQDALWTKNSKGAANNWGTHGDLWFPHVYESNQDPTSPAGANPFGRWDYGPWFWPPISVAADRSTLPEPSTTPEAFHDTMLVNGTAYPYLSVEPKTYRFRILNAANDRGLNLSLFYADPNDPSGTEVKMVPAGPNPTFPAGWPTDGRDGGVPDPATKGPNMIQIGSESGFLPFPVEHPNQPVNYNYNRRDIVVLNVQEKNLFLGPAERADVIIDFSQFAGKTIILYNDAPAPTPASDPRVDYFTGNTDQTASGGAPSTKRGFGPNTRTVMQFRVAGTPAAPFNLAKLQADLPVAFKATQPAPLVPQPTKPVASGGYGPTEQYAKIQDYAMSLKPLNSDYTQSTIPVTIPFHPKAIQELWDPYGRMNATLGIELPFTNQFNQTTIPMGYAEPATEFITDGQPQIWKVTHNGVDTHPVHFHMVDVQVINRVGWDGAIRPPDDNELGWKETVRMNPLEDIIVAMRPKSQSLPAAWAATNPDANGLPLPKSIRLIDPVLPPDARIIATDFGNIPGGTGTPVAGVVTTVANNDVNFTDYGYEYVWHCHILGHEENDFMRPVIFKTSLSAPAAPYFVPGGVAPATGEIGGAFGGGASVPGKLNYVTQNVINPNINQVVLQWNDGAPVMAPSSFRIVRDGTPIAEVSYLPGYPPIYTDTAVNPNTTYSYQIAAFNAVGPTTALDGPKSVTTGAWTNATAVTIKDSKPVGHVVGTNVQFIASGSGASNLLNLAVAYQYRFLLNNVEVQAFSTNNMWTLPDTTPVGSYSITVQARTSPSQNPVATSIITHLVNNPPDPPVTVASPVPAIYSAAPVLVSLTATTNAPPVTVYYTVDGNLPTTASPIYTSPIVVTGTTNIQYFAVDVNGTAEAVHSDTWYIHVPDLVASAQINNGATLTKSRAVKLTLSAFDPAGVDTMQFSNDGLTWPFVEEPYTAQKDWTLATGSDGPRTVYIRFRDKSLPTGVQYPPITAGITLDTTAPITSPSPIAGYYSNGPISVTLTTNEPATIYYTTDSSTPTTASNVYATPIPVLNAAGQTTTIKYFAVDSAGNAETVKTGAWTMHISDMVASVQINNGANWTLPQNVTLTLNATDPAHVINYDLSNDGTNWTGPAAFTEPTTTASWTLTPGEGLKTVYVRFRDGTNNLYDPVIASILFGAKDGIIPGASSYLTSALNAMRIAVGMKTATPLDLVHADVAPYSKGQSKPDGKIDLLDAYMILMRSLGLITTF
ncbi:MAG TPA: chitobiase/beta-hexosaminidase C-terminal domain-containing protein [Desulfuromonadaceae bacterium]|jgi:FtsP/CotA-like multicopper oxidase with cupredoxin domain